MTIQLYEAIYLIKLSIFHHKQAKNAVETSSLVNIDITVRARALDWVLVPLTRDSTLVDVSLRYVKISLVIALCPDLTWIVDVVYVLMNVS